MLVGAHGRAPNALVYPESLRFLAAHALGLVKSSAFRCAGGGGRRGFQSGAYQAGPGAGCGAVPSLIWGSARPLRHPRACTFLNLAATLPDHGH